MTIKANHPLKTMLEPVDSVETPDPHTAVIKLAHPHPALLLAMSPALMPIIPKHIYGNGGDIKAHPANLKQVGPGPSRLTEHKQAENSPPAKFEKIFIPGRPSTHNTVVRLKS